MPAGGLQHRHQAIDNRGVALVEQPVQAFAAPPDPHIQVGTEDLADPLDASDVRRP